MARHGENIRKRADGRWEGRYKAFDESRGKCIYRSVYGKDYREAKEKLVKAKAGLLLQARGEGGHAGAMPVRGEESTRIGSGCGKTAAARAGGIRECGSEGGCGCGPLFTQVAKEWLAMAHSERKYSTYIKYETIYRKHLDGSIGACQLSADAASRLQERLDSYLSGMALSESIQKSIVCVANQILAFANKKYLSAIPLLAQPLTRAKKQAVQIFSRAEQAKLLAYIYGKTDKTSAVILLSLHTGLRLGELCALKWADIDPMGMTFTVSRTVQRIAVSGHGTKTILMETEPKSESSRRTIPLSAELLEALSRFRGEEPYVFGGKKPLEPRTMQYRFKKLLREAAVGNRNFHALRHTFATNCVENDMDAKALSELLGHSNVKITLNRYVHPTMDSKRTQLGRLSRFYGQICGQVA